MKKVSTLFILLLIASTLLSACKPAATPAPTAAPAKVFKVAVIMPSLINDLAFSQSMYDALLLIQKEMGADKFEFVYSDNMFKVDEAAAAIRDYASKGYDLVIAHGS